MKKSVLTLICCACLLASLLSACLQDETAPSIHLSDTNPTTVDPTNSPLLPTENPTDPPTNPQATLPTQPTDPETGLPVYVAGSIQLMDRNADIFDFERKYRQTYYTISGAFIELLDEEERSDFYAWFGELSKENNYGEFQEEMSLVSFVKRYNISRDEFDKAVERGISFTSPESLRMESCEPPNADIIYTFNNEIINEYYRYE